MQVRQFEDKNLSHYSYALLDEAVNEIILIDPARNIQPYLDFAQITGAKIIAVIETHPHADFVSGHLELHQRFNATIYVSKLVNALYPHRTFDDGDVLLSGNTKLIALNTPGHSPDSICVILESAGKAKAVFTGDTLFIGDCGRPDLREGAGDIQRSRTELAALMYQSLRSKLMPLHNDLIVYPAHGAGTLCGKALSDANSSTMAAEKLSNWSLQEQTQEEFTASLLADQPFVPTYFPFDVELNRRGAAPLKESLRCAGYIDPTERDTANWVIDIRATEAFRKGHLPKSINLLSGGKFETWLGSIIEPGEKFYLAGSNKMDLDAALLRCAAIGYESQTAGMLLLNNGPLEDDLINIREFKHNTNSYTIVDVRNTSEVKETKGFDHSINIPLAELRKKIYEIPLNKPVVVHCAGGYRSAAAASLIKAQLNGSVHIFDMGEVIKDFL